MAEEDKAMTVPVSEEMRDAAVKRGLIERMRNSRLRITPGHRDAVTAKRAGRLTQR